VQEFAADTRSSSMRSGQGVARHRALFVLIAKLFSAQCLHAHSQLAQFDRIRAHA
jgi:hypothetical protein